MQFTGKGGDFAGIAFIVVGQQARRAEGLQKALLVPPALGLLHLAGPFIDGAGTRAGFDVGASPEAGDSGQIVGGSGGEGLNRIFRGRLVSLAVSLEIQKPVAEEFNDTRPGISRGFPAALPSKSSPTIF